MIETVNFNGIKYPFFQTQGFASKFAFPFALEVCNGKGLDIGCNRLEWALPGATPIDITIDSGFSAYKLPNDKFDYIFSSHCLEHLDDWVGALDYWIEHIKPGGVLFLYLPDFSQEYWRPWNNRKHIHSFTPEIINSYMVSKLTNVFTSGVDLNNSFMSMGEIV